MIESLSDLVGGSFSVWSRLNTSLPISLGDLGVHWASLFASAAFIDSLDQSKELVSDILGCTPPTSVHLSLTLKDLVLASGRDDWSSLERVNLPLQQRAFFQGC